MTGVEGMVEIAHALESILKRVRSGGRQLQADFIIALLQFAGVLKEMLRRISDARSPQEAQGIRAALDRLAQFRTSNITARGRAEPDRCSDAPRVPDRPGVFLPYSRLARIRLRRIRPLGADHLDTTGPPYAGARDKSVASASEHRGLRVRKRSRLLPFEPAPRAEAPVRHSTASLRPRPVRERRFQWASFRRGRAPAPPTPHNPACPRFKTSLRVIRRLARAAQESIQR